MAELYLQDLPTVSGQHIAVGTLRAEDTTTQPAVMAPNYQGKLNPTLCTMGDL